MCVLFLENNGYWQLCPCSSWIFLIFFFFLIKTVHKYKPWPLFAVFHHWLNGEERDIQSFFFWKDGYSGGQEIWLASIPLRILALSLYWKCLLGLAQRRSSILDSISCKDHRCFQGINKWTTNVQWITHLFQRQLDSTKTAHWK